MGVFIYLYVCLFSKNERFSAFEMFNVIADRNATYRKIFSRVDIIFDPFYFST